MVLVVAIKAKRKVLILCRVVLITVGGPHGMAPFESIRYLRVFFSNSEGASCWVPV